MNTAARTKCRAYGEEKPLGEREPPRRRRRRRRSGGIPSSPSPAGLLRACSASVRTRGTHRTAKAARAGQGARAARRVLLDRQIRSKQPRRGNPTDEMRPGRREQRPLWRSLVLLYLHRQSCMQGSAHPRFCFARAAELRRVGLGSVRGDPNKHYNPPWKASSAMGASTSTNRPLTSKVTNEGENDRVKYASSAMQGLRMSMQDALAVELDLDALKDTSFFGVYDGHGGAEVAMYCAKRFHVMLREEEDFLNNLPYAITSVCSRLDDELEAPNVWRASLHPHRSSESSDCFQFLNTGVCANMWHSPEAASYDLPSYEGSTACVVIIRGNQITVGNVGDSRCVLSKNGQAIDLSTDHKPNVQLERQRILRVGGQVWREKFPVKDSGGGIREQWGPYCVEGKLSTSRALGDFAYKNIVYQPQHQMVTHVPDIRVAKITGDTEFLVIASDGIWDHMSSQDVVDFVHEKLNLGEETLRTTCEKLVENCLESRNNATATLVQFKPGADQPIPVLPDIEEGSDEVAGGTSGARAEHQDKPEGSGEQQLDLDDDDAGDGEALALLFGKP